MIYIMGVQSVRETGTAKIFMHGRSQAVRLPKEFRLPGKDDYKAPRNFREEILDSLKQGIPPQMKDQIERYFKNLSE